MTQSQTRVLGLNHRNWARDVFPTPQVPLGKWIRLELAGDISYELANGPDDEAAKLAVRGGDIEDVPGVMWKSGAVFW